MIPNLKGRTVAIVGRAGSIIGTGHGKAIDAADVVIRINWILPIDPALSADTGARTDLMYHCRRAKTATRTALELGTPTHRVKGKNRRRVARDFFKRPDDFRPTTGFMCAVDCVKAGALEVRLYGFDVFRSGHVQERDPGGENSSRPLGWTHNPEEERVAWRTLFKRHKHIIPDAILRKAIR